MTAAAHAGAMEGIRVLDLSGGIAAAYCGKLFADHGAEVLLLEPPNGFRTRRLPPFAPGIEGAEASGMHAYLSTNKRSVVCTDRADLLRVARGASLAIDDGPAGRHALDIETFKTVSADADVLSITWFGKDGPYRNFAGSDGICLALSSQIDWIGEPGRAPLIPGGYHAQIIAGVTAFIAASGQILARELGNAYGFQLIDVSVYESSICLTEIEAYRGHCGLPVRTRIGVNRFRSTYPLGIYACRDGWLGVTVVTPAQWDGFCRLLGLRHLTDIERYWSSEARLEDADVLEPLITAAVSDRSAGELARTGQRRKVPLSLVPTMDKLLAVDQYISRAAFADVTHPDIGPMPLPVTPFRLHGAPATAGGTVSRLGEDTSAVLAAAGGAE